MLIKVQVTDLDYNNSDVTSTVNCPIALALRRLTKEDSRATRFVRFNEVCWRDGSSSKLSEDVENRQRAWMWFYMVNQNSRQALEYVEFAQFYSPHSFEFMLDIPAAFVKESQKPQSPREKLEEWLNERISQNQHSNDEGTRGLRCAYELTRDIGLPKAFGEG